MAGLLDFLNSDEAALGLGLLAAGGPTTDPNQSGFGARLAQGVGYAQQRKDAAMRQRFQQSQIDENTSQAEARRAAAAQAARTQAAQDQWLQRFQRGGSTPGAPGTGGVPGSATPGGGLLENMTADDIVAARLAGLPDLTPTWKETRPDMVEVAPGMWADKKSIQPGVNQAALGARTRDRVEQSDIGMRGDFVEVEDASGRKWKVPKASLVGGAPSSMPPALTGPVTPGRPMIGPGAGYRTEGAMRGTAGLTDNPVAAARAELASMEREFPNVKDEASRTALRQRATELQQVIASDGAGVATATPPAYTGLAGPMIGPGAGVPSVAGAIPSGMSRAETDAADIAKLRQVEQVKADVIPAAQATNKYTAAADAIGVINQALTHPGMQTATGLSGLINPKNYLPGTDAKDFQIVLNRLKGTAFLSAYNELKGGGAITEVEGKKAEDAIAALDRAQTTESFTKALKDYRAILVRGLRKSGATDADIETIAGPGGREASGRVLDQVPRGTTKPAGGLSVDDLVKKYAR